VLPIIGENNSIVLPHKLVFKLLHKAIDLYCALLLQSNKDHNLTVIETKITYNTAKCPENVLG
jgi:hypothetical protein